MGAAVTLKADAKDDDGSVKSVAFYVGNTLVGTANAAPYQVSVEGVEPGMHSAVAVVTDNSGLTWMSEYVTFTVEGSAESSSSAVVKSSSSVVASSSSAQPPVESSSDACVVIPGEDPESCGTIGIAPFAMQRATEAEAGFYRIFDIQGRPLFAGDRKPAKMSAAHVIVIEYTSAGKTLRHYIQ